MRNRFKKGDQKRHRFIVKEQDFATFNGEVVHPVCSTYKLGQEMEWSSRLFMLDIIDEDEEGVGTMLHIDHLNPVFVGQEVELIATFESFEDRNLLCNIEVYSQEQLVAKGRTGQKLLKRSSLNTLMKAKK